MGAGKVYPLGDPSFLNSKTLYSKLDASTKELSPPLIKWTLTSSS